ncbi:MAG: alginate export family protein, partial [Flaviramulus sp.]
MKKQYVILGLFLGCLQFTQAQFTLDGEFRPRTEYRNGFGSLIADDADAGFGISTRARLNAGYQTEAYKFYLSMQDVMVWGENRQILPYDLNNSFAIFQAWAEINLGSGWSTKLGRQVLSYDDQRILGGLDWAQQGRNHDAGLIKYKKDKFMLDVALAFNQDYSNPTGFVNAGTA